MSSFNLEEFKQFLKQKTGYVKETATDIICRCPFCGDSVKNKNKGHLYIKKDLTVFHCFRCEEAGPITVLLSLLEYKGQIPVQSKQKANKLYPVIAKTFVLDDCDSEAKYAYLKSRIRQVELIDQKKLRLVWNVEEFLNCNHIQLSIDPTWLHVLGTHYIGFITFHGSSIICRCIVNDSQLPRYYKIRLDDQIDYYAIEELTFKDYPNIVVTEGIFDAISAKEIYNFDNVVYVAALSKGYVSALYWAMWTFGLTHSNVYLILDSDVDEDRFKWLAYKSFVRNLALIYPVDGKDINEANQLIKIDV